MINRNSLNALAFERQHITSPANENEYIELIRLLSPITTPYWSTPGGPPELQNRAQFDTLSYNNMLRGERRLVKGRYRGGSVGYVLREEQPLFAAAYRKPREDMSLDEGMMLDLIKKSHGITVAQIKKQTGLLVKHISPLLHKLAMRFLVAEDQFADGWDTLWYPFEELYPEQRLDEYDRTHAIAELLKRQAYAYGYASPTSARSLYGFTIADIKSAAAALLDSLTFVEDELDGDLVWVLADDAEALSSEREAVHGAWAFNLSDPIVKANEGFLKGRYTLEGAEPMYYINVDGVFCGAVMGRFNFSGNEHRDVVLELDYDEVCRRRDDIISAIYKRIDPFSSPLLSFMGEALLV